MLEQRIPERTEEVFMQEFLREHAELTPLNFKEDDFSKKFISKRKSLMDVPCGTGRDAYYILMAFPHLKVIGIDIYRPCIELAKKHFQHDSLEFKVGNIYDLNGDRVEMVRIAFSLHHLDDLEQAFASVRKVLPEKGELVLGDFNRAVFNPVAYLWSEKRKEWGDQYVEMFSQDKISVQGTKFSTGTAIYFDSLIAAYTPAEVEKSLIKTGFEVKAVYFCGDQGEFFGMIAAKK